MIEDNTPRPCRVLMEGGRWVVPPGQRMPDWQRRMLPIPYLPETDLKQDGRAWGKPSKKAGAA
jgi:hypothetical protein